jgi:glycosyltransferase involved in cell wall biosynthesis
VRRVVVDARLLHYNQAGIGRYLRHLYTAMAALLEAEGGRAGLDVTVLYHRSDRERALDTWFRRTARAWTPAHNRLERWVLALETLRLHPALLHSPDHVCPQPLGWRAVVTVHDLAFRRLPQTHAAESRAYYAGLERSVRQATRVICVSDATRRDLLDLTSCLPERVRVVAEAPDPAYVPHGPTAPSARPYIVFVGTIEPRKNLGTLLRALARVSPGERPELRVIGAQGGDADARHLIAALGLERDVRLLGRVDTAEVAAHYRRAAALAYPSFLEGFGLPILEAMACGAPVITSNTSSMPEVAGGAALLVDPADTAGLAAAIQDVVRSAALREDLRRRGFERVRAFSWERAARETVAVFREALEG